MRADVSAQFGPFPPRAVVLDDHTHNRRMTSRRLQSRGFLVTECKSVDEFLAAWSPGMADLIIADWQLSDTDHGDMVLANVRSRDWDVPFVLVSGKLDEDERRVRVLEVLLSEGGAKFVTRGEGGIARACDEGEALIERRDLTLLKVILSLRAGALDGAAVRSSKGTVTFKEQLARMLVAPAEKNKAFAALSALRSERIIEGGA